MLENAETYTKQAFKILDRDKTEIVYNGDWFRKMTYEEVLKLNSRVTMQQMLAREDFKARVEGGKEVRLHEMQYPIMQGWDSVEIRADVELGGTDQLFNILVGRDLQKEEAHAAADRHDDASSGRSGRRSEDVQVLRELRGRG